MARKKKDMGSQPTTRSQNTSIKKNKKKKAKLTARTNKSTLDKKKSQSPKKQQEVIAKLVISKDKNLTAEGDNEKKQIPITNPDKVTEVFIESEDDNERIELHIGNNFNEEDLGFCFKIRKKKMWWTDEETEALLEGVKKHGRGKWKEILMDNTNIYKGRRTTRDLSDRMRTLDKRSSIFVYPNVVYTEVDEHNKPVLDKDGNPRTYFCQFPHEAALLAANDRVFLNNRIIRMSCGQGDEKAFHIYKTFRRDGGRIRVRKMSGRSKKRNDGW